MAVMPNDQTSHLESDQKTVESVISLDMPGKMAAPTTVLVVLSTHFKHGVLVVVAQMVEQCTRVLPYLDVSNFIIFHFTHIFVEMNFSYEPIKRLDFQ